MPLLLKLFEEETGNVRNRLCEMMFGVALTVTVPVGQVALAQQAAPAVAANWTAGAKVSDTAGAEVGTITQVDGEFVILKTDKHDVRLPKASFTAQGAGFIMAMTRIEVNAAVEKALAEANQKLAAGATVTGPQGATVGTIDALDADTVTIKLTSGKLVRVERTGIAPGPDGAVIGLTVAELEAAAQQAEAAPAAEADGDAPS